MTKSADTVFQALTAFADGQSRNRIFFAPDIPAKKFTNARSKYITRNEDIIVLIDDTIFGSAKDGLAISENYIYAKGTLGDAKSVKISSIRSIRSQSNKLGSLDIYFGGNLFVTLGTIDREDHAFVMGMLEAAFAASNAKDKSAAAKTAKSPKSVAVTTEAAKTEAPAKTVPCAECSASLPEGAKFCLECGAKVMPKGVCLECNAKLPDKAKFCPECGASAGKAAAKTDNTPLVSGPQRDVSSINEKLKLLAEKTERDLVSSGKVSAYFYDCENLYPTVNIEHRSKNSLKVSITVETDGRADDLEEVEEAINDYVFDSYLTPGLIKIFGEDGYEALEFDVTARVTSLASEIDPRRVTGGLGGSRDINAGWEVRDGRTICRWILVWIELSEGEVAGCAAGYSGGGSFQMEKFYLKHNGSDITLLQVDNEDKINGDFADFSTVVPPNAVVICEDCQDEILSWHDEDVWDDAETLYLLDEKARGLVASGDMLIHRTGEPSFLIRVLESIGITSRPSK